MAESTEEKESEAAPVTTPVAEDFWSRLKHHRVAQWVLAYTGAALAIAHGQELMADAFGWPHIIARVVTLALVLGAPVAALLAWYHGDKTRHKISGPELAILTVLLLIGGGLMWAFSRGGHEPAGSVVAAEQHAAIAADEKSIAVLPFVDLSPGKDQEYFADGISEEILNSLTGIQDLKVSGRTSSFSFKGKNENMKVIGATLGVAHLLEGSVRKSGDQLRITAQLVKASDGFHLWSQTYNRPMADVFKVQEEIAASVARALEVTLGVGTLANRPGMTRNAQAYDAYLSGLDKQHALTPDGMHNSIDEFQRATRFDPDFALAWYSLAISYGQLTGLTRLSAEEMQHLNDQATAAINEVGRIWPQSPLLPIYAGGRLLDTGDWAGAERESRKVDAANKVSARKIEWDDIDPGRLILLVATDHSRQAIPALERAKARDPLDAGTSLFLGEAYANSGNLAAAIAEQDRGLQLENQQSVSKPSALVTALATGDRQLIDKRLALAIGNTSFGLDLNAEMKPYLDKPADALRVLREIAASKPNPILIGGMALWAAYFGDTKLSLELAGDPSQAVSRSTQALTLWRPVMARVRKDPGFKELVQKMGLVDYWREFGWGEHCKPVGKDDFECT